MKRTITAIFLVAAVMAANVRTSSACTGITLKSADGCTVVARSVEWAASDNHGRYVVVPRGHEWLSMVPGGGTGRSFAGRYGYVGLAVEQDEFVVEGLNEKGLSAGLFYFPDYGRYEDYDPALRDSNISDFQLVSYILGRCATVADVKEEIGKVHIHGFDPRSSTVHWRFADPSGAQVVLEVIDGKCIFYDNTVGVLTNSPSFDWQLTNLNNYVNLLPGRAGENRLGNMDLRSFGGGSGFLGLPGDVTPPSRFVKAAFYQNTAPVRANPDEASLEAFRILSAFNIPVGIQFPKGEDVADIPSATQITSVSDMSGLKLYYRTMWNSEIRCFELGKLNFAKIKFVSAPLDTVKSDPIHYIKL